jgi:hypothetical protein
MTEQMIFHYTDSAGYKAISAQPDWIFKASQPPGAHKAGAYFTTLRPESNRFSARTRIPKAKQQFVFAFRGDEGLEALEGGRGAYIFWTPIDYVVVESRQAYHGLSEDLNDRRS